MIRIMCPLTDLQRPLLISLATKNNDQQPGEAYMVLDPNRDIFDQLAYQINMKNVQNYDDFKNIFLNERVTGTTTTRLPYWANDRNNIIMKESMLDTHILSVGGFPGMLAIIGGELDNEREMIGTELDNQKWISIKNRVFGSMTHKSMFNLIVNRINHDKELCHHALNILNEPPDHRYRMESWIVVLGWIEFIVALLVLIFIAFVSHTIYKTRHLEFNKYWRSRLLICGSAFVWVIALLLGNDFLWRPNEGLFGSNEAYYKYICNIHVFFTVGSAEPLFFVVFLFIIKSKTSQKGNSLYMEDPNYYVFKWSILCTIPIVIVHIIILILDSSSISEPRQLFWTTYDSERGKCAVPIISTAAFAIFFVIFLLFFFVITNRFSKTILNRNLINRIRLSLGSFVLFLPLEVAIRVVLIFTLKFGNTSLGLFHAFFFVDVAVALVAILEFALFPVLDSIGFRISFTNLRLTKQSINKLMRNDYDGAGISQCDHKDVISVHTNQQDMSNSNNIMTPLSQSTTGAGGAEQQMDQNQILKQKFFDNLASNKNGGAGDTGNGAGGILTIGDDDDDFIFNDNPGSGDGQHVIEMDRLSSNSGSGSGGGTTHRSPKSPAFDRVLHTDDINRPVSPLSTPLSSASSSSKSPPSVFSLNNNNNNNNNNNQQQTGYQAPSSGGHERKKSRRFSLSAKKHKQMKEKEQQSQSPSSSNPSSPTLASVSTSPPNNQSNVRSMFQPTPVDDFKNQLMKYSKNNRF
ncbi:hypothetical protein DFA_06424 [Cavenderia fasciculata]|uniref:Uncharacterized protein n=1 Tax=Cavenderia fasciculata TaxID=261658 RepID=F4PIY8_CACFS|nr:uncharacterized protein DFA_06424 [Cavenderia fasciculata]EGG24274.1 hypothetical protein DFA_06424 [Cavenderia fasciculata]|eukprot:XP_004362125.1 hypothetical protein DFA_06424 [Cavenderia fasciculata]